MSEIARHILDLFLHLDVHLAQVAAFLGAWLYGFLFLIIFCETGLVVTPFLPGDSLLFAVGALIAVPGSGLSYPLMFIVLLLAAFCGDNVNYLVGSRIGVRIFKPGSKWLRPEHLERTQDFYNRHGAKTVILARFVPIVRTFAPFVAGVGTMRYRRFIGFSVAGALFWVGALLTMGYQFGNLPAIRRNFHFVIVAIILISVLPAVVEALRARRRALAKGAR